MSMEFSFGAGPKIAVRVEAYSGEIGSVALAPAEDFNLIVDRDPDLAEKVYRWCLAYSQKQEWLLDLPFALRSLTPFEEKVLSQLRNISQGETMAYKELAAKCGSPKAFRAAGRACGKNPWPFFVPCHRILASDGSLGGFSQGLEVKRRLLAFEHLIVH